MVYLKTIQKITPKDVAVSGTIDEETYLKKFKGVFSPLSAPPWIRLWVRSHQARLIIHRARRSVCCDPEKR